MIIMSIYSIWLKIEEQVLPEKKHYHLFNTKEKPFYLAYYHESHVLRILLIHKNLSLFSMCPPTSWGVENVLEDLGVSTLARIGRSKYIRKDSRILDRLQEVNHFVLFFHIHIIYWLTYCILKDPHVKLFIWNFLLYTIIATFAMH